MENKSEWVQQLPFALFALRQMPNSDSGFSPFDLVFGFKVRTPIDALYYGIVENENCNLNVTEWTLSLAEKLENHTAALKAAISKERRIAHMNIGSRERSLSVGDKVLYRIPGLSCKLSDSWKGPYNIVAVCGQVNYRLNKGNSRKGGKVVNINTLKKWHESCNISRLDVVLHDEPDESKLKLNGCVKVSMRVN